MLFKHRSYIFKFTCEKCKLNEAHTFMSDHLFSARRLDFTHVKTECCSWNFPKCLHKKYESHVLTFLQLIGLVFHTWMIIFTWTLNYIFKYLPCDYVSWQCDTSLVIQPTFIRLFTAALLLWHVKLSSMEKRQLPGPQCNEREISTNSTWGIRLQLWQRAWPT